MLAYRFLIRSHSMPRYRLWFTWVLCLCAWRGPMPIVHRHSLESHALETNVGLAAHAMHHHGHDMGHGDSGWHVHFVWPSSGGDDVPVDPEHAAPTLAGPCVFEQSASDSCARGSAPAETFRGDWATAGPLGLFCLGLPAKPLPRPEIKSKRISPQAALCVARC